MDICKRSVILGVTLLAICVLVKTMGFCKFAKLFPPKEKSQLIKDDKAPKLQKGDNMAQGKPTPITLNETPLIKASPDLFLSSSVQNATVASSTVYVGRSTLRTGGANSQDSGHCPSEYTKQLNASCYKFVDSSAGANRSEAQSECKGDSAHLVFIESKKENDFLIGEIGNNTEHWIGIHERPNLFWDNGNQVTFVNINPDNSNTFKDGKDCYVMSENDERKWLGKQCSEYYSYICEYEGAECPSGYAITHNSSCYKFGGCGLRATWSEARSACQSDSSHLVFIETKEENDFLVREAECNGQYWIGIHERPNLFWDNGNQVIFANIDQHSPFTFNDGTGCFKMYQDGNRYWLDSNCAQRYHYICEHEDIIRNKSNVSGYIGDECPEEYTSKHSASCYKFADSTANLSKARSACKNDASHLVFIETEEENDFLINQATRGITYWIGIHERPNLFWDNGNQVTFANIDPDDTDSLLKHNGCYSMFNNTKRYWRDSSCSQKHGYICEYEY